MAVPALRRRQPNTMPAEKPAFGKKGTPLIYAGTKLTDVLTTENSLVSTTRVSIWLDPNAPPTGRARLDAPKMTPKFPETKHTVKRVVHNIGQFPVVERVGRESYDPVLGNGNSVRGCLRVLLRGSLRLLLSRSSEFVSIAAPRTLR